MRLAVRQAEDADAERLAALRLLAAKEITLQRGGELLLRSAGSLPSSGSAGADRLLLLAEIEDVAVGYLQAALSPLDGGSLCRVEEIYVEPEAREVGAGEALLDHAREWAVALGTEGIDVVALPGSREVKNFLESAGFAARLIVMHQRLDDGER